MPGRNFNANQYRFGYNKGSEKDDEISGSGNHITTLHRELDTRLGRWWSTDPEEQENPDHSPYCSMGNNPIQNNDPDGDIFGIDNLVGAVVAAGVDYGFQVAGNIAKNGLSSGVLYENIDKTSIAISAGAGFLTSGASSLETVLAKGVSKEVVKQVARTEAKHLVVNTGEAVLKQVNDGVNQGKSLKNSVKGVNLVDASKDGAIANVAFNLPGVKTKGIKEAEKNAEHKIARMTTAPNYKRTQAAKVAVKKAELKNVPNAAAREASENSTQNYRDHQSVLPKK